MDVFSLTYVSSASGIYTRDIYRNIALSSRNYNTSNNITGMLLIFNETIIQFLEGDELTVRMLYNRIEKDPRHKGPIVVSTRNLEAREFPDWTIGYKEIIESDDPNYIFLLNRMNLIQNFPDPASRTTDALLDSFKRSSGLMVA